MARTPAYVLFPPSFRPHCMTTIHRTLVRKRPMLHLQSSLPTQRCELFLLSLFTKTQLRAKWIQVLRRPMLCHIQLRVPPETTVQKFRLCPRLHLCCVHLLRRLCRPFLFRGSFCLGPAAAEPPLLASVKPPWIMGSTVRSLLHRPPHDQPPPCKNRARLGAPRLLRLCPGPASTQFLLCRSNTPPMRRHLLRPYLVPSLQTHLVMSAP